MTIMAAWLRNSEGSYSFVQNLYDQMIQSLPKAAKFDDTMEFFGLSIVWTTQGHTLFFFLELTTGTGSLIIISRKDLR